MNSKYLSILCLLGFAPVCIGQVEKNCPNGVHSSFQAPGEERVDFCSAEENDAYIIEWRRLLKAEISNLPADYIEIIKPVLKLMTGSRMKEYCLYVVGELPEVRLVSVLVSEGHKPTECNSTDSKMINTPLINYSISRVIMSQKDSYIVRAVYSCGSMCGGSFEYNVSLNKAGDFYIESEKLLSLH